MTRATKGAIAVAWVVVASVIAGVMIGQWLLPSSPDGPLVGIVGLFVAVVCLKWLERH